MDPDPGGPKTYGPGSASFSEEIPGIKIREEETKKLWYIQKQINIIYINTFSVPSVISELV
jgi:hypothetical protein